MAKEVEKVRPGLVRPHDSSYEEAAFVVPYSGGVQFGTPDFTAIRPPETGGKIQDVWARNPIIISLRAVSRGFLWTTEFWWRTAIPIAVGVALLILFIYG